MDMIRHNVQQKTWIKPNNTFQHKNVILTATHSGVRVIIWADYAATEPEFKVVNSQI